MRQTRFVCRLVLAAAALALLLSPTRPVAGQTPLHDELRMRLEFLRTSGSVRVASATVPASDLLVSSYERLNYRPVWRDAARSAALVEALAGLRADGLDPRDYFTSAVQASLRNADTSVRAQADAELLRTHALLLAAQHLRHGRVGATTLTPHASLDSPRLDASTVDWLLAADPRAALDAMRPAHFTYRGLSAALLRLRSFEAAGGMPRPGLRLLARDSAGGDVAALRARLRLEGDLPGAADTAGVRFDAALEAAVRSWQHRHALQPDGVVGPATLRELSVPLSVRIDQVRVNLERARWVTHDLADTFIVVNVAGALAYFVRDGVSRFETRVIVGRTATQTPVFSATMRYIELNPSWTVPPGIVGEVLAQIRRDPAWLRRQRMRVIDAGGRSIDPGRIDFARYSGRTFPWTFRQDPGPLNPLGAIKLMFPNPYNVYLHDTPNRDLFQRDDRLFSHGCIRVQDPVGLAALALDSEAWSADSLRAAMAAGATRTIPLARPLPVLVLYWTAATDLHGELHFYRDVYGRDARLLRALDSR